MVDKSDGIEELLAAIEAFLSCWQWSINFGVSAACVKWKEESVKMPLNVMDVYFCSFNKLI